MHKTENKTPFTFQFLKQQKSFERTGVKQVKNKIILFQTLLFVKEFPAWPGDSNVWSYRTTWFRKQGWFSVGLGCSLPWAVIWRTVFFRAWSSSGRDQSFHCLLLQKHFCFSSGLKAEAQELWISTRSCTDAGDELEFTCLQLIHLSQSSPDKSWAAQVPFAFTSSWKLH